MKAKDLKNSILQMAVEGKLVPQDPADEPASALLERIREERRKLVAEKKIKAPKGGESVIYLASDGSRCEKLVDAKGRESEPVCIDEEIPFDVPDGWEWARLGSLGFIERGSGIKRSEVTPDGVRCVRYGELYTSYGRTFTNAISHTSEHVAASAHELVYGDVLVTLTGENKPDIGKPLAYLGSERVVYGGDLAAIKQHGQNPSYLALFLDSETGRSQKRELATGDIIIHISGEKLSSLLIPIPPLAEQQRIVAKVDELTALTNQLPR